jgi:hypothetical protein
MGIRFYCPNGHKLNVKDFQAGQTGICPACGAKMPIPLHSTRPSSRFEKSPPSAGGSDPSIAPAEAAAPLAADPEPTTPVATSAAAAAASAPTMFAADPVATPAQAPADPLAAAGNVVWYVRPPSGGQFGPASTDVMRIWLTEGRVSTDTLVWREGWRDWQVAGDVFPQLSAAMTSSAMPELEAILAEPVAAPTYVHPPKPHAPAQRTQLIAFGVLALVVLILFVIFLVLWLK